MEDRNLIKIYTELDASLHSAYDPCILLFFIARDMQAARPFLWTYVIS